MKQHYTKLNQRTWQ